MINSIDELRKICQTGGSKVPHRKVSIYLTWLFIKTPITANQVSLLGLIIALIGVFLIGFGGYIYSIIGLSFMQLYFLLDCVDGEVARYRGSSKLGEYSDSLVHAIVDPLLFVGLSFGLYREVKEISVFVFGFSSSLSILLSDVIHMRRITLEIFPEVNVQVKMDESSTFLNEMFTILMSLAGTLFLNWGIMSVFLIAIIIDGLLYLTSGALFYLNFRYLTLLFYGITLPITWILYAILTMSMLKKGNRSSLLDILLYYYFYRLKAST